MFLLYNLLLTVLAPIWIPWMLWRSSRRKEKPNWSERFGRLPLVPRKDRRRVWVHAVSVGEVVAAVPILRELRKALPEYEILLSVTTSSGHRTARELDPAPFDHLVYFPLDVVRFQWRAMAAARPAVVAVMETELWMNFLWAAKSVGAKTLLVNGRISDRSFPRAMRFRGFYRALLSFVDRCLMQTEEDARRIRALGAIEAVILGNAKFDQAAESATASPKEWRRILGIEDGRFVVVVGSTRGAEEEALVLDAVEKVGLSAVSVVHAPRHLERAEAIREEAVRRFGSAAMRSKGESGPYVILDTYGELGSVYSVADVAVVGGGFSDLGGQNLVQPLAHGKPVLHGPHMRNFAEVARAAEEAGAARVCADADSLAAAIRELIADPDLRNRMGLAARKLCEQNLGAAARYAAAIADAARTVEPKAPTASKG